jgi:hypothetical protein
MKGRNGVCCPSGEQLPVRMNACPLPMRLLELVEQARLAHARLADDVDDPKFPPRAVEGALENVHLAGAPDIGAEAARQSRLEPRRALTDRIDPIDLLWLGLALDRVDADKGCLNEPLH